MSQHSSGILPFRLKGGRLEVLLVHPGGPFWAKKDDGAWSIPKGLKEENESALDAARRELEEETGFKAEGELVDLGEIRQPSGKIIHAWALEGDLDETRVISNTFRLEWPRRSGIIREFPEIDRAGWFGMDLALKKIQEGQSGFLDRLVEAKNIEWGKGLKATTNPREKEFMAPQSPITRWLKD